MEGVISFYGLGNFESNSFEKFVLRSIHAKEEERETRRKLEPFGISGQLCPGMLHKLMELNQGPIV